MIYAQAADQDFVGVETDHGAALTFRHVHLDALTPEDHQFYQERSRDFGGVRSMFGLTAACLVKLRTAFNADSVFQQYKTYYANKETGVPEDLKCDGHWVIESDGRSVGVLSASTLTNIHIPEALLGGAERHQYVELGVEVIEAYRSSVRNAQHLYINIMQGLHRLELFKNRPFCDVTSEAWVLMAIDGVGAVNKGIFRMPSPLIPWKTDDKYFYVWPVHVRDVPVVGGV